MIRRIKNLWNLSQYKPEREASPVGTVSSRINLVKDTPPVKAEFISTGTQEEYEEFQREEKGFRGIFGL
jgi:hypothetical protein